MFYIRRLYQVTVSIKRKVCMLRIMSNFEMERDKKSQSLPEHPHVNQETNFDNAVKQSSSKKKFHLKPGDDYKGKGPLSNRAFKRMKRMHEKSNSQEGKKKQPSVKPTDLDSVSQEFMNETGHYFENGLRKVYPYYFVFSTHAKGRWVDRTAMDVFTDEFRQETPEYYRAGIANGNVKVNGKAITIDYKFKAHDFLENKIHRHELPVTMESIEIIENNDDVLVVNKPSSIPVHPCGRFRHNSLTFLLAKQLHLYNLRTIYRLDRLTSGVIIFTKTEAQAQLMQGHIKDRLVQKQYLAKVEGEFPSEKIECHEPLDVLSHKIGLWYVNKEKGKQSHTTFERLSFNGKTSIVRCKPHTGRTHQIRIHLQYLGFPITNDALYNHDAWGPNKGKDGDFGKSKEQLLKDLELHHTREKHITTKPSELSKDEKESGVQAVPHKDSDEQEHISKKMKLEDAASVNQNSSRLSETGKPPKLELETTDLPAFNPEKLHRDSHCRECKLVYEDPKPEELVMYLHALSYQGPGWKFETSVPKWATDDGHETWMESL